VPAGHNAFVGEDFFAVVGARTLREPERIDPLRRVGRVLIQIETASKTYRVVTNETARRSVIVPMPGVVKAGLRIELLPLEP